MHDQSLLIREKHPFTLTLSWPSLVVSPEIGWLGIRAELDIGRALYRGKLASQHWLWAAFGFGAISQRTGWALTAEVHSNGGFTHASWTVQHPAPIGRIILTLSLLLDHLRARLLQGPEHCVSAVTSVYKQTRISLSKFRNYRFKCLALGPIANTR